MVKIEAYSVTQGAAFDCTGKAGSKKVQDADLALTSTSTSTIKVSGTNLAAMNDSGVALVSVIATVNGKKVSGTFIRATAVK